MGDIVEFRNAAVGRRSRSTEVPAEGAQILFFLGVRYERHESDVPSKQARKRRSRSSGPLDKPRRSPAKGKTTRQRA